MANIKVLVGGATGRMGQHTVNAIQREPNLELVGGTCSPGSSQKGSIKLNNGDSVPLSSNLEQLINQTNPDIYVDFTNATAFIENAQLVISNGIHTVVGISGLSKEDTEVLASLQNLYQTGLAIIPMFAIGAVVLRKLCEEASQYFDYVDIIESHHEHKIDTPSGFALDLANVLTKNKEYSRNNAEMETLDNTRGGEKQGVSIHSIRLPGRSSHHEVIFGTSGQILTLKHDTLDRECYMPGVIKTINYVYSNSVFTIGLENILGI
jgi:4-hydroxy-tetrahydrodipicolinate reductase